MMDTKRADWKLSGPLTGFQTELKPMSEMQAKEEIACCGGPAGPPSNIWERPGYVLMHFVKRFKKTPAGPVPIVKTAWMNQARGFKRCDHCCTQHSV